MRKLTISIIGVIGLVGLAAWLVIHDQAQVKFRENEALSRQQGTQLAELTAEHQRLSELVAQADSYFAPERSGATDRSTELAKLRSEAAALCLQIGELGKRRAESSWPRPWRAASMPDYTERGGSVSVVSDSDSAEYKEQLHKMASRSEQNPKMGDAYNLKYAVWKYTVAHDGQFPSSLDQLAPYCYQGNLPLAGTDKARDPMAGTNEFELVYQGSRQELTNVPEEAVAMMRERQAWPTPAGKRARIYVMATGHVVVVESADNFQSWESEHVVPPAIGGP